MAVKAVCVRENGGRLRGGPAALSGWPAALLLCAGLARVATSAKSLELDHSIPNEFTIYDMNYMIVVYMFHPVCALGFELEYLPLGILKSIESLRRPKGDNNSSPSLLLCAGLARVTTSALRETRGARAEDGTV